MAITLINDGSGDGYYVGGPAPTITWDMGGTETGADVEIYLYKGGIQNRLLGSGADFDESWSDWGTIDTDLATGSDYAIYIVHEVEPWDDTGSTFSIAAKTEINDTLDTSESQAVSVKSNIQSPSDTLDVSEAQVISTAGQAPTDTINVGEGQVVSTKDNAQSPSDTLDMSENQSISVKDNAQSPADTLDVSEGQSISAKSNIQEPGDTINISEGQVISTEDKTALTRRFYYPDANLFTATFSVGRNVGTAAQPEFLQFASITNVNLIIDNSTAKGLTDLSDGDIIKIDLGEARTITQLCVKATGAGTFIEVWGSSDPTDIDFDESSYLGIVGANDSWESTEFSGTYRYWFLIAKGSAPISEIILGQYYHLPIRWDIGSQRDGIIHGVDVNRSDSGVEYKNKRHEPRKTWELSWKYLPTTMKSTLETMRNNVDRNHRKFIFTESFNKYYVKMTSDSLKFKESDAPNIFGTTLKLVEQLS